MNTNQLVEGKYCSGAIPDAPDARDFKWGDQIGDASVPFDWSQEYDIEATIVAAIGDPTFKLFVDNQGGAFCCGGESIHKKGEVAAAIHNKSYVRKSAKFPYAQVFVPPGGSSAKPLFEIYSTQGMGNESDTPSYIDGNPPTEAFMEQIGDITQEARQNATKDKSAAYAQVSIDIDSVAQAIRDGYGVILGIYGQNNGTWLTDFPLPPTSSDVWAHWVFAGKVKMINGKKYIGFLNSWGTSVGEQGWQWVSEDYFDAEFGFFQIWTFLYETIPALGPLFTRSIRFGMKGTDVAQLQTLLKISSDGIFGKDTLASVKAFQTSHSLVADGIVGPITQAALKD